MSVKISKLWGDNKFNNLSNDSKLFYIYLATHPSLKTVGVVSINLNVAKEQISLDLDSLRECSTELIKDKYIHVKKYNNDIYFIVPAHFNSLPKSESVNLNIIKDLETLPVKLVSFLSSINIRANMKIKRFVKPSKEEILEFCMKEGYEIDADKFIEFYEDEASKRGRNDVWINSRGKVVRDWKATLRKVWFKDERKLTICKDAPKGYEYFYVELNGKNHTPDFWKDGLPQSKDFLISKELKKKYERITK